MKKLMPQEDPFDAMYYVKIYLDTHYDILEGERDFLVVHRVKSPRLHRDFQAWYDLLGESVPYRHRKAVKAFHALLPKRMYVDGARHYYGIRPKSNVEWQR